MITAHQFAENKVTPQRSSFLHKEVTTGETAGGFGKIGIAFSTPPFFVAAPLYSSQVDGDHYNRAFPNVNYKYLKITPIFNTPVESPGAQPLQLRVVGWSSVVQGQKNLELLVPNVLAQVTLTTSSTESGTIPEAYAGVGSSIAFYTARDINVVALTDFTSLPLFYNDNTNTNPSYFIIDTQGAQWLDFEVITNEGNVYEGKAYSALLSSYSL